MLVQTLILINILSSTLVNSKFYNNSPPLQTETKSDTFYIDTIFETVNEKPTSTKTIIEITEGCLLDSTDPQWCLENDGSIVDEIDDDGCSHMRCKKLPFSSDGQCGEDIGIRCPPGQCCSKEGKCGNSSSHCELEEGCQDFYGNCIDGILPLLLTTTTTKSCPSYAVPKCGQPISTIEGCPIPKCTFSSKTSTTTTKISCPTNKIPTNICNDKGLKLTTTTDSNGCPTPVCEELPYSTNGKCSLEDGKCPPGECCSKYGWCGKSDKHCKIDKGCQPLFGICKDDDIITTTTKKSCPTDSASPDTCTKNGGTVVYETDENGCRHIKCKELPYSTDDRCGKDYGTRCPSGKCCSKYGWCGQSDKHCKIKEGCQSLYGSCENEDITSPIKTTSTTSRKICPTNAIPPKYCHEQGKRLTSTIKNGCPTPICVELPYTSNGKCGIEDGKCPFGECCSKYGWCGESDKHCKIDNGCQPLFGTCKDDGSIPKTKTTTTTTKKSTSKTKKSSTTSKKSSTTSKKSSTTSKKSSTTSKKSSTTTTKKSKTTTTKKSSTSTTTKKSTSTNKGKCGKDYGKCSSGYCCSKYGYCGKNDGYCGKGCQSEYGKCN
eukprot:jgi/Orpsp1_1/1179532/evm.model.c7180000069740.1